MNIDSFKIRLEKLSKSNPDFNFSFGTKLELADFDVVQNDMGIVFPKKIIDFYLVTNGLRTLNPDFEILELSKLKIENSLMHFATFDKINKVCFKTEKMNKANEWTIIEMETQYELTLTISSFWSNKVWHWLEKEHKIWTDRFWENEKK